MKTITATAARNRIAEAWGSARLEPVAVRSRGETIAIILSPTEYERLTRGSRRPRQGGFMAGLFPGMNWHEVLERPAAGFEEYA